MSHDYPSYQIEQCCKCGQVEITNHETKICIGCEKRERVEKNAQKLKLIPNNFPVTQEDLDEIFSDEDLARE